MDGVSKEILYFVRIIFFVLHNIGKDRSEKIISKLLEVSYTATVGHESFPAVHEKPERVQNGLYNKKDEKYNIGSNFFLSEVKGRKHEKEPS